MDADRDLIKAADENFIGSYRKLVEHCPGAVQREFDGIFAFATGLPIGIFNGCIVAGPTATEDLDEGLDWIESLDVPYRLWVNEELIGQRAPVALRRGMGQDLWLMPQMVLRPVPESPQPAPGVISRAVSDGPSLDEYRGIYLQGGMSDNVARRLFSDSLAFDPEVQLVIASLGDRPVGTSLAIRTGDVAGVYAVETQRDARRRGVGRAATWAAVDAGRDWGCDTVVLQSSEMGFPMYRDMGFRTVVRYATYRRSP